MSDSVLTVVFSQFNRSDYTLRSYRSLVENTTLPTDLIIVDAGSEKEHFDRLKECSSSGSVKVTVIPLRENISIGFHRNLAIRMCHTPLLLVTDNDMDYTPGWDKKASEILFRSEADILGLWVHPWHGKIADVNDEVFEGNTVAGNCWLSKGGEIYDKVGWFKETPAHRFSAEIGEDLDFTIRMREQGYKLYSTKENLMSHFGAIRSDGQKAAGF